MDKYKKAIEAALRLIHEGHHQLAEEILTDALRDDSGLH